EFIRWTYARAMAHREPRYAAMAKWGLTVTADDIANVTTPQDFETLIARTLEDQKGSTDAH
ncbi:MAG: ATPase, partial [Pseudomonadota bacterium]